MTTHSFGRWNAVAGQDDGDVVFAAVGQGRFDEDFARLLDGDITARTSAIAVSSTIFVSPSVHSKI